VGRPSGLTPALAAKIARHLARGLSTGAAATKVGVPKRTLERWLQIASRDNSKWWQSIVFRAGGYRRLIHSRRLARARCEHGVGPEAMVAMLYSEIMEALTDGKVPLDVASKALEMAQDELRDTLAAESLSFARTELARWHPGDQRMSGIGDIADGDE